MMSGAGDFKVKLQSMQQAIKTTDLEFTFMILGMGACDLCKTCTYTAGEPCRFPNDAIVCLEACGIDVMRLMSDHDMK